jgi:hypothetical protein
MKPKPHGWKEGIITKNLMSVGGSGHYKGSTVRYRRYKTYADKDGFKHSDHEWHYIDTDNYNLVRTTQLLIEGEDFIDERIIYQERNKSK